MAGCVAESVLHSSSAASDVYKRQIIAEPGRSGGGELDNAGPRLRLHLDDVAQTNIVQPGSRVSYRYLFADDAMAALDDLEQWVDTEFDGEYRIVSYTYPRAHETKATPLCRLLSD